MLSRCLFAALNNRLNKKTIPLLTARFAGRLTEWMKPFRLPSKFYSSTSGLQSGGACEIKTKPAA